MVHLGKKPGSKAYRLLDLTSKKIVVSRDVIFDEEKEWNWNATGKTEDSSSGSFNIDIRSIEDARSVQAISDDEDNNEEDHQSEEEEDVQHGNDEEPLSRST